MKAKLLELSGKYYGTKVEIDTGGGSTTTISVWASSGTPSERELACHVYTVKDWKTNAMVDDGFGGKFQIHESDIVCDSHYECTKSLQIARLLVKAINEAVDIPLLIGSET